MASLSYTQTRTEPIKAENKAGKMQATEPSEESKLTTAKAIQNLCNNIKEMQNDINAMKNDIKQDLSSFKSEMNKKLEEVGADIHN